MTPRVVDVKAAALLLNTSVWSVRRYIDDGVLPVVRYPSAKNPGEFSRRVLVTVEDIDKFIAARKVTR